MGLLGAKTEIPAKQEVKTCESVRAKQLGIGRSKLFSIPWIPRETQLYSPNELTRSPESKDLTSPTMLMLSQRASVPCCLSSVALSPILRSRSAIFQFSASQQSDRNQRKSLIGFDKTTDRDQQKR